MCIRDRDIPRSTAAQTPAATDLEESLQTKIMKQLSRSSQNFRARMEARGPQSEQQPYEAHTAGGLRSRNSVYEAYWAKFKTEHDNQEPYVDVNDLQSIDLDSMKHPKQIRDEKMLEKVL